MLLKWKEPPSIRAIQLLPLGSFALLLNLCTSYGAPAIQNVQFATQVAKYGRFEITLSIGDTTARNLQLPYDPSPPAGLDPAYELHRGISVDAEFSPDNWQTVYRQPAFHYLYFQDGGLKPSWNGQSHEWYYPTGETAWKVRFSPHREGSWQFKITARDQAGLSESSLHSFEVIASASKGFVRVSKTDPRYFEWDIGSPFLSPGVQAQAGGAPGDPILNNESNYIEFQKNHIQLLRNWISNFYGAGWIQWLGGRNIYDGYLPRPGIIPFHDSVRDQDVMTLAIAYPEDWFDGCRFQFWRNPAVKPYTSYQLSVTYWGEGIQGPRISGSPAFGLVGKISEDWEANCYDPGTGTVVTDYGGDTADWRILKGNWFSGDRNFLPRVYLGLENVTGGIAYVRSVSMREVLGGGEFGPEILHEPSMEYELYFPEVSLYMMDKIVELAEEYDIFLKLVLMDKNDKIYNKLDDDGSFVIGGEEDNQDGFYGLGRGRNKTRWLQQAWWRYLQARWGYSPNIHSWELTNEGDPFLSKHWEMTDELGKFMHCSVFGVNVGSGDGQACNFEHPNRHLVTTSFWTSFPGYAEETDEGFWGNPKYPNVDYADVHAYISTSPAPDSERILMEKDAAHYHLWHSQEYGGWELGIPVLRGEAGMVPYDGSTDDLGGLGLDRDTQGIWYHNYLWAGLDSGALYEVYWYANPHIYNESVYDHRPEAKALFNFIKNIPLNSGHYQDLSPVVSNPELRVVGQKDIVNGRAHLWIQNKNHTWHNVVNGLNIPTVSGVIQINGFESNEVYLVDWWDTSSGQISSQDSVPAGSDGTLTVSISELQTDKALKLRPAGSPDTPFTPQNLRLRVR